MLFFCYVTVNAQTSQTFTRSIKFIDLRETSNASFWGHTREITRLVMTAIESGSIKSFMIDYENEASATMLTEEEYMMHKTFYHIFKNQKYANFLFPGDIPYIGLDQTISIVDDKECVHYVNFYSHENFSADGKTRQYRFSVTWKDFIAVLKKRSDILYTPNAYGVWWRGNTFITNEHYFMDYNTDDFIELSRKNNITANENNNSNDKISFDSLRGAKYSSSAMDFYIFEERDADYWKTKQIGFGTLPQEISYENEKRFIFDWSDFAAVLEKTNTAASSTIYTLADAFVLKKFHYSDIIQSIQISKNGKFTNGKTDALCSNHLKESFHTNPLLNTKFHTELIESLYLGDTSNKHLNIAGKSIAEILYGYVFNGTLAAYENDSLLRPMTIDDFKYNASQYLDVPQIMYEGIYKRGDTVTFNVGESWPYQTRYYIVQENVNGTDLFNEPSLISKLKRYYPPLIPVNELNIIECIQHLSFDHEGNNKKYKLEVVALYVGGDGPSNIRGIQYPVCYVRWDDFKSLLLKDSRATFIYKGLQQNLADIIENRDYLSTFLKTGYVEIGE